MRRCLTPRHPLLPPPRTLLRRLFGKEVHQFVTLNSRMAGAPDEAHRDGRVGGVEVGEEGAELEAEMLAGRGGGVGQGQEKGLVVD
ncbi:hypothetical protein JCM11251_002926 [Rhodosporidiobolus azoricus]